MAAALRSGLAPNATEGNPPPFFTGEGANAQRVQVSPDPGKHVVAHVFKTSIDPYVGKLAVLRVHQGTIRQGSHLFVGDARKPIKIAHLLKLMTVMTTTVLFLSKRKRTGPVDGRRIIRFGHSV